MRIDTLAGRVRRIPRTTALGGLTIAALTAAMASTPAAAAHGRLSTGRPAAASRPAAAAPHSAAVTRAIATAAPVGHLTTRNCTEVGSSATCDLYAMTGTTSVLGTPVPIWGFSSTGAAGSATAPGPVLVVNQGDSVSITLHNGLNENVSLALPGQSAVTRAGGVGDDVAGIGNGATRTYTFSATRPGTFLYEAGHTPDGTRQVAMGLAGALVVLPPGATTAYGTAGTTYDDDAVLVLSEIDPALNADPAQFDMRSFHPAYRLINGKPFPASDPISTDQNHKVLLRYVNAGAQTHAMSVLGAHQVEVAQDGHLSAYPTTLTAESIDPGETVDTIVTMPSGPEAKLAVYENAQHLDNNGQANASPYQVAFGGMLTFLDTNAPAPSSDGVGPVPAHVAATPNPSDGLSDVTVTADLSDATTGGSTVDQAEFVVDDATTTGPGFGTPMTATYGTVNVTGAHGVIPAVPAGGATCDPDPMTHAVPLALSCLDAGKHKIYVRAHDLAGNWGVVSSVVFNLPKTGPATTNGSADSPTNGSADVALSATGDDSAAGGTITAAEYFIDDEAQTNGSGHVMTRNRTATVVSEDATIPQATIQAMSEGVHHLYVHSKDSLGLWGPVLDVPLNVDLTGPAVDAVSIGPNPSNGLISDKSNPGYAMVSGQITDRDAGGGLQNVVTDAEVFIDNVKAPGTGLQLLAVDGAMNQRQEAVYGLIPLSQIRALSNGDHAIYLRGKDAAGNWGNTQAAHLMVDKVAPVLGTLSVTPNPTGGAANVTASATVADATGIQKAEYWFGTTDPGVGKATATQPDTTTVPGGLRLTIPTAGLPYPSNQTLHVRVMDQAGNWSAVATATFAVSKPNLIFRTNFESGDPAFSSTTSNTNVTITNAASVPTGYETGSTRGMQTTLPSGSTRVAYATDTTPTAEPTYHARFAFNRNTLNVGTATATLFRAVSGTNGTAFTLQYRVSGGTAQVQIVLNGNTGTAPGNWYSLAAGANTIQLDWTSGLNGTLALVVNGSTVQTLARNNGNLRVDAVQLGLVSGFNTSSGTAYFDSFSSGRAVAA